MNLFSRPTRPLGAVTAFTYIERTCLRLAIARVSHLLAPAGGTCVLAPRVSHILAPAVGTCVLAPTGPTRYSLHREPSGPKIFGPCRCFWSLSLFLALVMSLCCVKFAHIAFRACSHHKASGSNRTTSLPAGSHQRARTSSILDLQFASPLSDPP